MIEKKSVSVKKRKEDFMILTAGVKEAHLFYHDMILKEFVV
jgi:hypothetical protein